MSKAKSAGKRYATEQIEGSYFRGWVRDQLREASRMDPSEVLPLETREDAEVIARNVLQQLEWDMKRDLPARQVNEMVGSSGSAHAFYEGFREQLDESVGPVADEILRMRGDQGTVRDAPRGRGKTEWIWSEDLRPGDVILPTKEEGGGEWTVISGPTETTVQRDEHTIHRLEFEISSNQGETRTARYPWETGVRIAKRGARESVREAGYVADFNTLDDLIRHAADELGATHVSGEGAHTKIYFPRGGQYPYEEATVRRKAGYWHADGPHARVGIESLPRGAKPIGRERGQRRAAETQRARFRAGQHVYVAFADSVDEGVIVEHGTGQFNLKRRLHDPYIVRITKGVDAGSEFPIAGDTIFSDPMAASIKSEELYRSAMGEQAHRGGQRRAAEATRERLYRGFRIEAEDATQLGYRLPGPGGGRPGKGRKTRVFFIYSPEDPEKPIKTADSMRHAIEYIDNYLGPESDVVDESTGSWEVIATDGGQTEILSRHKSRRAADRAARDTHMPGHRIEVVPSGAVPKVGETRREKIPGTRNVGIRMANAEERFIEFAMSTAGLSRPEAERALARYRKDRVIKIDPIMGQFSFKHGAFAEPDVLRRAAGLEEGARSRRRRRR